MKRLAALPVALVCLATLIVVAGAWSSPSGRTNVRRGDIVSASEAAMTPCNGYCEPCDPLPDGESYTVHGPDGPGADAYFEVSVYCVQEFIGTCDFFWGHCGENFAAAFDELSQAVEKGSPRQVDRVLRKFKNVAYIAEERSTIQILNCKNEVGGQIALTRRQLEYLTASD